MYAKYNNESRSCDHYFSGKAKTIAYFKCVFVALTPYNIVMCGLPRSGIFFFLYHIKGTIFEKKSTRGS